MALTSAQLREILSVAGIPAENAEDAVQKIMNGHITSINALREERDSFKQAAEQLPAIQKELEELKKHGDADWEQKYVNEHTEFEAYKTKVADEKTREQKTRLFRSLLKKCKVGERQIDNIVMVSGDEIDSLTVKDGKIEDSDALATKIKEKWSGFIMTEKQQGAQVDTPPDNSGGKPHEESRAAKLAAEYHKNLYGEVKKGD